MQQLQIQRRLFADTFNLDQAVKRGGADFGEVPKGCQQVFGNGFYIATRNGIKEEKGLLNFVVQILCLYEFFVPCLDILAPLR